jgi:diacylglycerol O-acyltransferase
MNHMATASMSVQDALWLTMDRPNNLMVVDGAMMLRGVPNPDSIRDVFAEVVRKFPVFGRRPVRSGLGWAWQDDPLFNIDAHLNRVEYDEPISMTEVQAFLAEQRSVPMPKDRPLWTSFLLHPVRLSDGTLGSAAVTRFHHSIADGVRLTQVMLGMCESDGAQVAAKVHRKGPQRTATAPDTDESHPSVVDSVRHAAGEAGSAVAHGVGGIIAGAAHAVRHPLSTVAHAPDLVASAVSAGVHGVEDGFELVRHPDRMLDALEILGVENYRGTNDVSSVTKLALASSPRTVWSGEPSTTKAMSWSDPIPLDQIKAIGRAAGATVNDVLLAAIAGGLRRYLADAGEELDEVVWMVPVNLKPFEENLPPDLGNYFALVFVPMPLDEDDPAERLIQMHHRMERIKNSDEAVLTFGLQRVVSTSPGQVAYFLTNFFANKAVGVLTNVPGPASLLTFAGEDVHQVVGFAPCSGNQPMTATIFSYNGHVTVGFATDAHLLPNPDLLAAHVVADLVDMGVELST